MRLTLGFSPCPNDTFIFDAMVHGRIDTEGLEFDYFLADVEELNRRALASEVDITKVSYHAYSYMSGNYYILDSGSALGHRNGPLLVSRQDMDELRQLGLSDEEILDVVLACTARSFFSRTLDALDVKPDEIYSELGPELVQVLALGRPFP